MYCIRCDDIKARGTARSYVTVPDMTHLHAYVVMLRCITRGCNTWQGHIPLYNITLKYMKLHYIILKYIT